MALEVFLAGGVRRLARRGHPPDGLAEIRAVLDDEEQHGDEVALTRLDEPHFGKNAASIEELVAACQSFATVAVLMEHNVKRAKEFIRLAHMVQGLSTQQKKIAIQQRNAGILDVKIEIERTRKRILDCQLEREIEKNKKSAPAERKEITPEERERRIREIFNLPTDDPPSAQGAGPVLHRSTQEIVNAVRRSRRRRRRSDTPPPE